MILRKVHDIAKAEVHGNIPLLLALDFRMRRIVASTLNFDSLSVCSHVINCRT